MQILTKERCVQRSSWSGICLLTVCGIWVGCATQLSADDEVDRVKAKFFEQHVRPLLIKNCFECHAGEKSKGGLKLDSIGQILTGGESGPAITPHEPEESLLIEAAGALDRLGRTKRF